MMQFLRADDCFRQPSLLCVLRLFFHLRDFRFHGFYKPCELFFAFLSCLGIDILGDAFTVHSRREPPLVEVVVYPFRSIYGVSFNY